MVGTPWLHAAFRTFESFWEAVDALEAEFAGHYAFVLGENLCTELLFKVLADDPYYLAESGLYCVVD